MKLTIEDKDRRTLIEALQVQVRFWLRSRNNDSVTLRQFARCETRAAVRILRAAKGAQ